MFTFKLEIKLIQKEILIKILGCSSLKIELKL